MARYKFQSGHAQAWYINQDPDVSARFVGNEFATDDEVVADYLIGHVDFNISLFASNDAARLRAGDTAENVPEDLLKEVGPEVVSRPITTTDITEAQKAHERKAGRPRQGAR